MKGLGSKEMRSEKEQKMQVTGFVGYSRDFILMGEKTQSSFEQRVEE